MSALVVSIGAGVASAGGGPASVVTTLYAVPDPRGLMVTSGGWAYCEQLRRLARRSRYTLLCGRYSKDGYLGPGLRADRHLDWGEPHYLAQLAEKIRAVHRRVGGELVLIGVSYSGFGVATLASHHPEIRPDRLIVIDSYLDLVARRKLLPDTHETAQEIDQETGGSEAALRRRSAGVAGLARLVRGGTRFTDIWSLSPDEERFFRGATCNRDANAGTLSKLARTVGRPVAAWVTTSRHGHDLWDYGAAILAGRNPGRRVTFRPGGAIPPGAIC